MRWLLFVAIVSLVSWRLWISYEEVGGDPTASPSPPREPAAVTATQQAERDRRGAIPRSETASPSRSRIHDIGARTQGYIDDGARRHTGQDD